MPLPKPKTSNVFIATYPIKWAVVDETVFLRRRGTGKEQYFHPTDDPNIYRADDGTEIHIHDKTV